MGMRYPLEYELSPKRIEPGVRWLTLRVKNVGTQALTSLDVRLNSLDAYSISVLGRGSYIAGLAPTEERVLNFQVSASFSTSLYVSVDGWQDGETFHWESPYVPLVVGREVAELVSLFAMAAPYLTLKEKISVEATVRGLAPTDGVRLEFWADTPGGEFEELADVETKALSDGEQATYSAEFTPQEEGVYTIYAYLYDDGRRLDRETEVVYAKA